MKRTMGIIEVVFDILYLCAGTVIGLFLIFTAGRSLQPTRLMAGIMALILAGGDAFHLIPRIRGTIADKIEALTATLGRGKQITSITMTIFYLFLWHIGLMIFLPSNALPWTITIYILAALRILLCLMPQNRWKERYSPQTWVIGRNVPFIIQGAMVAILFFFGRNSLPALRNMYLAIILSFAFYIPVIVWSNKYPKVGMLMLPKTCAYLWILVMCLAL